MKNEVWPYSKEQADLICDLVAEGQNLHVICKLDGQPPRWRVYEWFKEVPEFYDNYARAREDRADWRAARIDHVTGQVLAGTLDPQAARVVIDAEKWQAGKESAKYNDKIISEVSGPNGGPVQQQVALDPKAIAEAMKLFKEGI